MKVLVIGGAGYIGSHMVRTLLEEKFDTGVFGNASTGYREFIPVGTPFIKGDLRNESDIRKVFREYAIDAVMHFAASSIVPESMSNPRPWWEGVGKGVNFYESKMKYSTLAIAMVSQSEK